MRVSDTLRQALRSDWGPAIRHAVTVVAHAAGLAYALGYASGAALHRANAQLAQLVAHHGESVRHLQAAPAPAPEPAPEADDDLDPMACESGVEPWHVLTDREAARLLVANGASRRLAARTLGVSDRTVRRWLQEVA